MIKPTIQMLEEAQEDLAEITDYVAQETADTTLLLQLQELELKLGLLYCRLAKPVKQQLPRNNDDYAFMAQSEDI